MAALPDVARESERPSEAQARLLFVGSDAASLEVRRAQAEEAGYLASSAAWSTALAGGIGTALVFLLALGITWLLVIRRRRRGRPASGSDRR